MKVFTTKRKIVRKYKMVRDPGQFRYNRAGEKIQCYKRVEYQCLVKETFMFGISLGTVIIDKEKIPDWAILQLGCLGSTEWRSKFVGLEGIW